MSGKYPATLNCTDWIEGHKRKNAKYLVPDWTMYMDTTEYSLAKAFKDEGYYTAHIGKFHLGEDEKYWPENQGFDINLAGWRMGRPNTSKPSKGYFSPYGNPRLQNGPDGEYLTEQLANETVKQIEEHQDNPFFLNFWLYNVHTPTQAKQEKIDKYKALIQPGMQHTNATYAAMVEHMDDALSKVINKLDELNLTEKTIFVFTSDNGGLVRKEKNDPTNNIGLRDGKGSIYEGGVRIPFLIRYPGKVKANQVEQTPIISADVYPTLAKMANLSIPSSHQFDGKSITPVLKDKKLKREAIYWHYPHYHTLGAVPYSAIRKGDWKLIENFETGKMELFNLAKDQAETTDLFQAEPIKAKELQNELNKWRTKVKAQMPIPNPNSMK